MMKKIYEILNYKIEISAEFEWPARDNLQPFESQGEPDFCFNFKRGITNDEDSLVCKGKEKWITEFIELDSELLVREFSWYSKRDAVVRQRNERVWDVELSDEHFEKILKSDILWLIPLERLINQVCGMILHSAVIDWNGKGILFTGPSGIGKSTQASLWEKYEKARVLNGDKAGICKRDNEFYAYGLPYAGSSNIYINESVPISAIVVLEQAKENRIVEFKATEAFAKLYEESILIPWDNDFLENHIGVIQELVTKVPVLGLQCRPDMEAVAVLKEKIK